MNLTRRLSFLAILLFSSIGLKAHVNVLYPTAGETFITGYIVTIEWEIAQPHDLLNWDVYYSLDTGANWIPLAIGLPPATLNYDWLVPAEITNLGQIKVYMNNSGEDYIDYSGVFSIEPNTSPPFVDVAAENITIPCNVSNQQAAIQAWLANHGGASIINYCGDLVWTNDYSLSNDCGATGDSYVTFTATDACGSTETAALLLIEDVVPPTITSPPTNMSVESDGQGNIAQLNSWLNTHAGATATDGCGTISWTNNFTVFNISCGHAGSTTVTFIASDECDNVATAEATFTITDQVGPLLIQSATPLTISVSPDSDSLLQNWLSNHGGASAIDPEGVVTWQDDFTSLSDGCGITGSASVTFQASDVCGNSVSTTATVQLIDQAPPVINTLATDKSVSCSDPNSQVLLQEWLDSHGGANASDFGGGVFWQYNFPGLSDSCGITGQGAAIFTAMDLCGNSANTTSTFHLTDIESPVITSAALDTTVYCSKANINTVIQQWLNRHGGALAADACGIVNWTHDFSGVIDSCQLQASYPVTFTAWDECLNYVLTAATFNVLDTNTTTALTNEVNIEFLVYPNPASEILTVEFDNNGSLPVQLAIHDAFGRQIWLANTSLQQIRIPVDRFSAGMYFLSVRRDGMFGVRKILVND